MRLRRLFATALVCLTSACSTHYHTLKLDERSGTYPTSVKVDPGGVVTFDTSLDLRSYRYVLLKTQSNLRPNGLEFTMRSALAQAGMKRVYSIGELQRVAMDRGVKLMDADPASAFAERVGALLIVETSYRFVGDARMWVNLAVTDAGTGRTLLRVDHPRMVWSDFDGEALHPVLNELRRWIAQSSRSAT